MPRPIRIEYEDAYYHVMNRSRSGGRQPLFHDDAYFMTFLNTLAEAQARFNLVVHGYCLMTNHYHLLIQTPDANLGRAMRHINGVYTQCHNRMKRTDGPLFRGRYKAVLVEEDSYLLQLSRYIHRNPVETRRPMVNQLEHYPWSSYPAYINQSTCPEWLRREKVYDLLGKAHRYAGYKAYTEQGVDEELKAFYNRGNIAAVIGGKEFVNWLKATKVPALEEKTIINQMLPKPITMVWTNRTSIVRAFYLAVRLIDWKSTNHD